MAYDTGYVPYFDLKLYDEGFVLILPDAKAPDVLPEFQPQEKIFQVQKDSEEWGRKLEISTVGELNDQIVSFLPYPHLIATLFNGCAFGPPLPFTATSTWTWGSRCHTKKQPVPDTDHHQAWKP